MKIPIESVYEFHKIRTACHIACVNYFAGLVGYHFPEHDNDKNIEPMRTGYAYKNYAGYHREYNLPDNYDDLFVVARKTHHAHASHHIEFYNMDASKIPDICLIEMVCDWFSASFEQVYVVHEYEYKTVTEWFDAQMAHMNWTPAQLKTIRKTIDLIESRTNHDEVMNIWLPVLMQ